MGRSGMVALLCVQHVNSKRIRSTASQLEIIVTVSSQPAAPPCQNWRLLHNQHICCISSAAAPCHRLLQNRIAAASPTHCACRASRAAAALWPVRWDGGGPSKAHPAAAVCIVLPSPAHAAEPAAGRTSGAARRRSAAAAAAVLRQQLQAQRCSRCCWAAAAQAAQAWQRFGASPAAKPAEHLLLAVLSICQCERAALVALQSQAGGQGACNEAQPPNCAPIGRQHALRLAACMRSALSPSRANRILHIYCSHLQQACLPHYRSPTRHPHSWLLINMIVVN